MIRPATESDIPEIIRMAEGFWSDSPFPEVEYDPGSTEIMSRMCIDQGFMFVADIGGVHGFICGIEAPILGNFNVKSCSEVAWWVDEEYRDTGSGLDLIRALEAAAKEKGCKYINMVFMHTSMPDKIEKIYCKLGYNRAETTYSKVL